jgi:RNA polymerase sigma-70 factor, ECF subfamily
MAVEELMAACAPALQPIQPPLTVPNDFEASLEMTTLSDDALVALAKTGEVAAFARLIERHHRFCLSRAYSILRNHDDAEDEVQTAWVQAWTHLDSYEGQGCFCGWLSRIVSNQCLMRLRKTRLMPVMSVDEIFESEGSFRLEVIDQTALPEDLVGEDEVSSMLIKEIYGIPPLLREVLVMRDLHQLAMREIAGHLGISIPAAKSRLMRARLELKQRLVKHHGEKGGGTLLQRSGRRRAAYVQAN